MTAWSLCSVCPRLCNNDGGARERKRDRRQRERERGRVCSPPCRSQVYRAVDVNKPCTVSILFLFPPPFARDRDGAWIMVGGKTLVGTPNIK